MKPSEVVVAAVMGVDVAVFAARVRRMWEVRG